MVVDGCTLEQASVPRDHCRNNMPVAGAVLSIQTQSGALEACLQGRLRVLIMGAAVISPRIITTIVANCWVGLNDLRPGGRVPEFLSSPILAQSICITCFIHHQAHAF
jgi:hypothetical protein